MFRSEYKSIEKRVEVNEESNTTDEKNANNSTNDELSAQNKKPIFSDSMSSDGAVSSLSQKHIIPLYFHFYFIWLMAILFDYCRPPKTYSAIVSPNCVFAPQMIEFAFYPTFTSFRLAFVLFISLKTQMN